MVTNDELRNLWMEAVHKLMLHELNIMILTDEELDIVIAAVLNKRMKGAATGYLGRKYRTGIL